MHEYNRESVGDIVWISPAHLLAKCYLGDKET